MLCGRAIGGAGEECVTAQAYPVIEKIACFTTQLANDLGVTKVGREPGVEIFNAAGIGKITHTLTLRPWSNEAGTVMNPFDLFTDPFNLGTYYLQVYQTGTSPRISFLLYDNAGSNFGTLTLNGQGGAKFGVANKPCFAPNGTLYIDEGDGAINLYDITNNFAYIGTQPLMVTGNVLDNPNDPYIYVRASGTLYRYVMKTGVAAGLVYQSPPAGAALWGSNMLLSAGATTFIQDMNAGTSYFSDGGAVLYPSKIFQTIIGNRIYGCSAANSNRIGEVVGVYGISQALGDHFAFYQGNYYSISRLYSGTLA